MKQEIISFSNLFFSRFQEEIQNKDWSGALSTLNSAFAQNIPVYATYETSVRLLPIDDITILQLIFSANNNRTKGSIELDYDQTKKQIEAKMACVNT